MATVPADIADWTCQAVDAGANGSPGEVVREASAEQSAKRRLRKEAIGESPAPLAGPARQRIGTERCRVDSGVAAAQSAANRGDDRSSGRPHGSCLKQRPWRRERRYQPV